MPTPEFDLTKLQVDDAITETPRRRWWQPFAALLIPGGLIAALITAAVTPLIDDARHAVTGWISSQPAATPSPVSTRLAATIECAEHCVTDQPKLAMRGTVTGEPPPGHSLQLMTYAFHPARWYPGTKVPLVNGRWTAQIGSGPNVQPRIDQHFKVCLVDAGPEFDDDLANLTTDKAKVNVEGLERKPEPMTELACVTVIRRGG